MENNEREVTELLTIENLREHVQQMQQHMEQVTEEIMREMLELAGVDASDMSKDNLEEKREQLEKVGARIMFYQHPRQPGIGWVYLHREGKPPYGYRIEPDIVEITVSKDLVEFPFELEEGE